MKIFRSLPIDTSLLIILMVVLLGGFADEDQRYKKIRDALNKFTYLYPQQKVFLHMDKGFYQGGEDLWIKAYLVSGIDHMPDTFSTNLYVELISPAQTLVQIKRLQMFRGFGTGDFRLSDTLPEGLYQIRAYTAWMKNFNTEFYFERNFQLTNPVYKKIISPKEARMNIKELKQLDQKTTDIDLQFMPEGGYLVNGIESVVAFKAVNKLGLGEEINGTVYDEKGNTVTTFKSYFKGIGTFTLKPEKDRKYYAIARAGDDEVKVPIPQALESGIVMHAINTNPEEVSVSFSSNRPATNDPVANELIITCQVGGRIYFSKVLRLVDHKAELSIPRNIFPSGVLQITAFSGRGVPLTERLVFINLLGYMKIQFTASDSTTEEGKKVLLDIQVNDRQNRPLMANLSLSVTREITEPSGINHDNILSNLLLLSDLTGYVEDPLDYFNLPQHENSVALDNLMLTHGWRRFDWEGLLAGEYPEIRYHEEKGITVSGRITRDFFNIPLDKCRVQLSIMDEYNDVFTQYSADNGTFIFDNLVYYDTVSVKIEAWRPSGRRNLVILLPEEIEDKVTGHLGEYTLTTDSERDKKLHRMEVYKENKKVYEQEKAALQERRKSSLEGIYGEPDFVLYSEDFHIVNGNVLDVLKGRVPGVMITGNDVLIRGMNTIYGNTQPLYLIDGMPVNDVGAVTSIPLEDIERVEILKGPKTSFYGSRGANGVIAVYTKRGQFLIRGKIEFDMLGYSAPRKFYQPKYEPDKEPPHNYTLIWNPVIVTDAYGKAKVVFDKPEIQGNYRFDLQGISYMGHVGYAETVIGNQ